MRMKHILTITLISALLSSCALTKEERRMNRATKKLEKLVAKYPELKRTDTIRTIVEVPRVSVDTILKFKSDTIRIEKDNLKVEIVRLPGDTVYQVRAECDTVFVPVEVPCDTIQPTKVVASEKAKRKTDRWRTVALVFIGISVVLGVGHVMR